MKKRIVLLLIAVAFLLCTVTDWACVRKCREQGTDYDVCIHQCSSR